MYEWMHATGEVEPISVKSAHGGLQARGRTFVPYATFGSVVAYCSAEYRDTEPMSDPLQIRLPPPFGTLLYPSPIVWYSPHGLSHHWPATSSVVRVKLAEENNVESDSDDTEDGA